MVIFEPKPVRRREDEEIEDDEITREYKVHFGVPVKSAMPLGQRLQSRKTR